MQTLARTLTLFCVSFATSTLAFAAPIEANIDLICVTELPTTSFIVKQENDIVNVQVFHHNGAKYAPISNTLITPNDIETLKAQSEMVQKLGDSWHFKWKRSGCNADSPMFFQCVGEAEDFEINGMKVHPWALTVNDVTEKNLWGTFKKKNLDLRFEVEKKNYRVTMDYGPADCVTSTANNSTIKLKVESLKQ